MLYLYIHEHVWMCKYIIMSAETMLIVRSFQCEPHQQSPLRLISRLAVNTVDKQYRLTPTHLVSCSSWNTTHLLTQSYSKAMPMLKASLGVHYP